MVNTLDLRCEEENQTYFVKLSTKMTIIKTIDGFNKRKSLDINKNHQGAHYFRRLIFQMGDVDFYHTNKIHTYNLKAKMLKAILNQNEQEILLFLKMDV